MQAKKFRQAMHERAMADIVNEDTNASNASASTNTTTTKKNNVKGALEEEDSGADSDVVVDGADNVEDLENITHEELSERDDGLVREQNAYRERVNDASHSLRAVAFGQDRFKRRYWALPRLGGIFIEGMESGETQEENELEDEREQEAVEASQNSEEN